MISLVESSGEFFEEAQEDGETRPIFNEPLLRCGLELNFPLPCVLGRLTGLKFSMSGTWLHLHAVAAAAMYLFPGISPWHTGRKWLAPRAIDDAG